MRKQRAESAKQTSPGRNPGNKLSPMYFSSPERARHGGRMSDVSPFQGLGAASESSRSQGSALGLYLPALSGLPQIHQNQTGSYLGRRTSIHGITFRSPTHPQPQSPFLYPLPSLLCPRSSLLCPRSLALRPLPFALAPLKPGFMRYKPGFIPTSLSPARAILRSPFQTSLS